MFKAALCAAAVTPLNNKNDSDVAVLPRYDDDDCDYEVKFSAKLQNGNEIRLYISQNNESGQMTVWADENGNQIPVKDAADKLFNATQDMDTTYRMFASTFLNEQNKMAFPNEVKEDNQRLINALLPQLSEQINNSIGNHEKAIKTGNEVLVKAPVPQAQSQVKSVTQSQNLQPSSKLYQSAQTKPASSQANTKQSKQIRL